MNYKIGDKVTKCLCGCDNYIIYKKHYPYQGIPKYLPFHHLKHNGPWNKGLTKETNSSLKSIGIKNSSHMKKRSIEGENNGFIFYWKGKKQSEEMKNKRRIYDKTSMKESTKIKLRNKVMSRIASGIFHNPSKSLEARKKKSDSMKKKWKDDDYVKNVMRGLAKGLHIRPNIPESAVIEVIVEDNLNFEYTGDLTFMIDRFNPDFIDQENKLIIEVNGDYWHSLPNIIEKDIRKMKKYKDEGYRCLVITESETKDKNIIKEKIKCFLANEIHAPIHR